MLNINNKLNSLSLTIIIFFVLFLAINKHAFETKISSLFNSNENNNCERFHEGIIEEKKSPEESGNLCWWLDSGGIFEVNNNRGKTIHGDLVNNDYWKKMYLTNNPLDTENGLHPQNIFRLINKKTYVNTKVETIFKINSYNFSKSKNKNDSNGVLIMSRYMDENNLYYAGLRVDGNAVIKKKTNGIYKTLAITRYESKTIYNPTHNTISLPLNEWVGQKLITNNNENGGVDLTLYAYFPHSKDWEEILRVTDNLESTNSPPLSQSGNVGIRSDFMDVEFSSFIVESL